MGWLRTGVYSSICSKGQCHQKIWRLSYKVLFTWTMVRELVLQFTIHRQRGRNFQNGVFYSIIPVYWIVRNYFDTCAILECVIERRRKAGLRYTTSRCASLGMRHERCGESGAVHWCVEFGLVQYVLKCSNLKIFKCIFLVFILTHALTTFKKTASHGKYYFLQKCVSITGRMPNE